MLYKIYNGPSPAATVQVAVATGATLKTMLQIKMLAGFTPKIRAWGVSMDSAAAAAGVQWEICETGTIFATVTAHVAAGTVAWDAEALGVAAGTYFDYGTIDTGFTSTAEGTVVATRVFDSYFIQPTGVFAWEFSLGNAPVLSAISALRIRAKAAATVNAVCWAILEV